MQNPSATSNLESGGKGNRILQAALEVRVFGKK